ncbi:MAG: DUF1295 domain-containing protein [Pseudomonadota bacterium]
MKYVSILVPFVVGFTVLFFTAPLRDAALFNAIGQCLLFAAVVCLPLYRTGRMAYVDIGWPMGIVIIGFVAMLTLDGNDWRALAVGGVYLLVGGRMGIMALGLWRRGALRSELPRYAYQRRRWEKAGKTHHRLAAQAEVIAQGAFNASFLAFPAFIIASNPSPAVAALEVVGLVAWLLAFAFETLADRQKAAFVRQQKAIGNTEAVCDVGLWAYSRHPNYFGQWMGWNGVLIATLPSWLSLYMTVPVVLWMSLGAGAALVSYFMYNTLVFYSGAVPAEYYSVRKRPAYSDYQKRTSRFFPKRHR